MRHLVEEATSATLQSPKLVSGGDSGDTELADEWLVAACVAVADEAALDALVEQQLEAFCSAVAQMLTLNPKKARAGAGKRVATRASLTLRPQTQAGIFRLPDPLRRTWRDAYRAATRGAMADSRIESLEASRSGDEGRCRMCCGPPNACERKETEVMALDIDQALGD